jgi:hypothetical protein
MKRVTRMCSLAHPRSTQADNERRIATAKLASAEAAMDAANSELSDLKKQISIARVEERKASVALGQADALVKNLQVIFRV